MIFRFLARRKAEKAQANMLVDWTLATARTHFANRFDGNVAQDDNTRRQRFEAVCVVAAALATRLEEGVTVKKRLTRFYAAHLFDRFDIAMREGGVGDMSIGPRIKRLASGFYGRWRAYGGALLAADVEALTEAMVRNGLAENTQARHDADWLMQLYGQLQAKPIDTLGEGNENG